MGFPGAFARYLVGGEVAPLSGAHLGPAKGDVPLQLPQDEGGR